MSDQIEGSSLPPRRRTKKEEIPAKTTRPEIVDEMELGTSYAGASILLGIPSFIVFAVAIKWIMFLGDAPKGDNGSKLAFYEQPIGKMTLILLAFAIAAFVGNLLLGRGSHRVQLLARFSDDSVRRIDRSYLFRKVLSEKVKKRRFESISVRFSGDIYVVSLRDHQGNDDSLMQTKDDGDYRAFLTRIEKFTQLRVVR